MVSHICTCGETAACHGQRPVSCMPAARPVTLSLAEPRMRGATPVARASETLFVAPRPPDPVLYVCVDWLGLLRSPLLGVE